MTFTNPDKKPWRDLTDAEKGALLLAKHEGKEIELYCDCEWVSYQGRISALIIIRVKPVPVVEIHKIPLAANGFVYDPTRHTGRPVYEITYQKIDGKPDFASVGMGEV